MDYNELRIQYYDEAHKLVGKLMLAGVLLINVSVLISIGAVNPDETKMPVLNIVIDNKQTAIFLFMTVYFFCGVLSTYAAEKAFQIISQIDDKTTLNIMILKPALITGKWTYTFTGSLVLTGFSSLLFYHAFDISFQVSALIGIVASFPFFSTFVQGLAIKSYVAKKNLGE